ncbi:DUF1254 domain-containing protein [Paracoccus sp. PAR01]|uniref:DUF1254 domain-containing protein n=1 Tax=Paracoccus sp. PAR01 TaxID=2769282 RepID=UPI00178668FC|nr:DUF1254 domain-containing protein [Paracoccus sp. PAR01]MBD9529574.1 DUF1254 domain-containing protein [Paracoccus sp. PAR01]
MNRRTLLKLSVAAAVLPAFPALAQGPGANIRDAYIYTFPMVKNYLTMYQYAVEKNGSQYKGPFNEIVSVARVYTPEDTAIITPNSDTPYSFIVFDLRAEPVVVTMPAIEKGRYYSLQLVDLYTNNVDYPGTRMDGNEGGDFLITGPGWKGEVPAGIKRVIEMPTWLALGVVRTQLFAPDDLEKVKAIQAGYRSQPLSVWAGGAAPAAAPATDWPPISDALMETDFWALAAFLLPFAPVWPGDEPQRENLARLGISDGAAWPPADLAAETVAAMKAGIATIYKDIRDAAGTLTDSAKLFGTPRQMQGQYLTRAAAAQGGIYGNSAAEALYVIQVLDGDNVPMDGSATQYRLTFPADGLPPVEAFWSLTMYDRNSQLLVANPINRYLINSAMLDGLTRDDQGNITLYLQAESPGPEHEANWLPAPAAPFYTVMRLYLPKPEALDGRWTSAPIVKAG